jgi:cbb3-type cytochrome oxidase maturation protein
VIDDFLYLVPIALGLGLVGLIAFLWALNNGQYEDLDGAAERILFDEDDVPLNQKPRGNDRDASTSRRH